MGKIADYVEGRDITTLVHFTRLSNLDSILEHGLCPPSHCEAEEFDFEKNDGIRYDGQDAICLSIEFPNYPLFYRFQNDNPGVKWAVLEIDVSILWKKECCFCTTNAADNSMSMKSFASRQGIDSLKLLFEDYQGKSRKALNIPDYYPTNPQAEVLCLNVIEPDEISAIYLNESKSWQTYKAKYPDLDWKSGKYFTYRKDWGHWKNG